jgi:starvation-inducible DNA-binding protein
VEYLWVSTASAFFVFGDTGSSAGSDPLQRRSVDRVEALHSDRARDDVVQQSCGKVALLPRKICFTETFQKPTIVFARKKMNMTTSTITRTDSSRGNKSVMPPIDHETQAYGTTRKHPIALDQTACNASVDNLNQLLADTMTLRDLYKKHHWQASGPTFYQLHLLFDKHFEEQLELIDQLAERVQMLGGLALAMAPDVAETTLIPRPPKGREDATTQISRLLHAHEIILEEARAMAREASKHGDDGTNDLIVSNVIRTNEIEVWFLFMQIAQNDT